MALSEKCEKRLKIHSNEGSFPQEKISRQHAAWTHTGQKTRRQWCVQASTWCKEAAEAVADIISINYRILHLFVFGEGLGLGVGGGGGGVYVCVWWGAEGGLAGETGMESAVEKANQFLL